VNPGLQHGIDVVFHCGFINFFTIIRKWSAQRGADAFKFFQSNLLLSSLLEPILKKHLTRDGTVLKLYNVFTTRNELKLKMI
jgi:hypothetical protein